MVNILIGLIWIAIYFVYYISGTVNSFLRLILYAFKELDSDIVIIVTYVIDKIAGHYVYALRMWLW